MGGVHVVLLLIVPDEGQGDQQPPGAGDHKADDPAHHGREQGILQDPAAAPQDVGHHGHQEGDAGADIAPGVAVGGDLVHAALGGHVVEHGIIEGQGGLVEDLGQHVDDEEHHPAPGEAVEHTAHHPGGHGGLEEDLFRLLPIRQRAQDWPQQRHDDRDHGDGDGIVGRGLVAGDLPRVGTDGQLLEPDGNQGAGKHGVGRVAHVVQHPREFLSRQAPKHLGLVEPVE